MSNNDTISVSSKKVQKHLRITQPSPWVQRWTSLLNGGSTVLDLAAGGGRHGRMMIDLGHTVTFVDRTLEPLNDLASHDCAELIQADLEDGSPWPLGERQFDCVIAVNYLYRPLFDALIQALKPNGIFIYETFALGNENYARPRNPDHLLKSGELLEICAGRLQVVGYEHGLVTNADITGVKQRLCAVNNLGTSNRPDGEPQALETPLFNTFS